MTDCPKCGGYILEKDGVCRKCAGTEEPEPVYPGARRTRGSSTPQESPAVPPVVTKLSTIVFGVYLGMLLTALTGGVLYVVMVILEK